MFRKLKRYSRDPYYEIGYDMLLNHPKLMTDKWFLKAYFKKTIGYELGLNHPKTFNEKLQWLKLYDRKPEYTLMVDKFQAKHRVADKIGEQYVIPTLAVYNSVDEIALDKLPEQFVLKCNHDSGSVVICKDKSTFDLESAKKKLDFAVKRNWFWNKREWPYKNVKPCIIADSYLDDCTGNELRDYKFWCFNGKPVFMYCTIKGEEIYENFYDMDFNPVLIDHGFPRHYPEFEQPKSFGLMKDLSAKLSEGISFLRVDFFDVRGRVFFGEFTFYDWGGMRPFRGDWDKTLGDWIKLPID